MMIKKILFLTGTSLAINTLIINVVAAHCPLCTIGAGAAALGASWLGISSFSIGIFLGAFGLAMGLWFARLLSKKIRIPYQMFVFGVTSLILTILPLRELFFDNSSVYIQLFGDFGSLFNRTYYFDKFVAGSIVGAVILWISPYLSKKISAARAGKIFPYQGIILSFALLILTSFIFEILK